MLVLAQHARRKLGTDALYFMPGHIATGTGSEAGLTLPVESVSAMQGARAEELR